MTFLFSFRSMYFDCQLEITYLNGLALSESVQNSKFPSFSQLFYLPILVNDGLISVLTHD